MTRHTQRREVLSLIFEHTFKSQEIDEILLDAYDARDIVLTDYIKGCFEGVVEKTTILDEYISQNLAGWKIERISRVNLCILRLAVYEMLFCDEIPVGAAINESVELAKEYSGDDDWSFINGVLSSVAKKHTNVNAEKNIAIESEKDDVVNAEDTDVVEAEKNEISETETNSDDAEK